MTADDEQLCARLEADCLQNGSGLYGYHMGPPVGFLAAIRIRALSARIRALNVKIGEQARDSLAAERQADERIRELNAKIETSREWAADTTTKMKRMSARLQAAEKMAEALREITTVVCDDRMLSLAPARQALAAWEAK